ncbi:hypothetical protein RUM44_006966 [Polyplax serrata]|uniref:Uncharacterized protein n=1 Tax=Polyplax serrata TaxID=468196 RepID=A0ABR1AZJ5_POLSC
MSRRHICQVPVRGLGKQRPRPSATPHEAGHGKGTVVMARKIVEDNGRKEERQGLCPPVCAGNNRSEEVFAHCGNVVVAEDNTRPGRRRKEKSCAMPSGVVYQTT